MSVLQELIKAGEIKIAREEMRIKRLQARDAEHAQRRKEIIRQMYPQIAEYIGFESAVDKVRYLLLPVDIPECVLFGLCVFRNVDGGLVRTDPDEEVTAFFSDLYDIFTNDLEVALALAHKAWLAEHSTEPVYTDAEESA
jgi:hypothetical protein